MIIVSSAKNLIFILCRRLLASACRYLHRAVRFCAKRQRSYRTNCAKNTVLRKFGHRISPRRIYTKHQDIGAKFGDELFLVTSQETSDKMALKPMNCPHHTQIFASQPRSYREMPNTLFRNNDRLPRRENW